MKEFGPVGGRVPETFVRRPATVKVSKNCRKFCKLAQVLRTQYVVFGIAL